MKSNILISACILFCMIGFGQQNQSQNKTSLKLNVLQITSVQWDDATGIPYQQLPGANFGATSFEIIDNTTTAFLCNGTNQIIITNNTNGKAIKTFNVAFAPRDFVYDNGLFYVLTEFKVSVYNQNGKEVNTFTFPTTYLGVERLTRHNNATYLLLPSGNSLEIENNGKSIYPSELAGTITAKGHLVLTKINENNSYSIKLTSNNNQTYEQTYTSTKKVAGVFVIGATANRLILDVQTFVSENPITVERHIVSINITQNGLQQIVSSTKVPDCYYVLSNKDFYVAPTGTIYNMVTAPAGVFVFSLSELNTDTITDYPSDLTSIKYHFNDHLIQVDTK